MDALDTPQTPDAALAGAPPPINEEARAVRTGASFQRELQSKNDTTAHASEQVEQGHRLLDAVLRHVEPDAGVCVLCGIRENSPVEVWRGSPADAPISGLLQVRAWNELGCNAYWGAGLVRSDLAPGKRGGRADLRSMQAIVVDLDTPQAAARYERGDFPLALRPSAVVRTSATPSHRYQLTYLLREPETDIEAWQNAARKLEYAWGADHCSKDPNHVWRLPGTINWPSDKKKACGRVPELSVLVDLDEGVRYSLDDFDDLPEAPEQATSTEPSNETDEKPSRLWARAMDIIPPGYLRDEIERNEITTLKDDGSPDRSAYDHRLCKELAKTDRTYGDALVLYRSGQAAGKVFAKKFSERGESYLRRTWEKAVSEVREQVANISSLGLKSALRFEVLNMVGRGTIHRATDLLALEFPDQQWAVRDFIPIGLTVIAGAPKTGKSWAALQLAIAVADGGKALGRFDTVSGDVLYLALEDNQRRGKARLSQLLGGQKCPARLQICFDWNRLDKGGLEALTSWLEEHPEARLVILDTAQRIKPAEGGGRANAYERDYAIFSPLQQLAMQYGVAVVLVHHLRKTNLHGGEDIVERVSGSTGITAAADAILIMDRKRCDLTGTFFLTGRDVEEAKYEAEFDPEGGVWTVSGFASGRRISKSRVAVIQAIQTAGRPLSVADIATATSSSGEATRRLLTRMSDDGDLRKVTDGTLVRYAAMTMIN